MNIQLRESQKKADPPARNVRKVAKHCVFSDDLCVGWVEK